MFSRIYDHPDVIVTTQAQVTRLRYDTDQVSDGRIVMAVYSDATHAIMLTHSWTGQTPAELSILVHEMVHHLQNKAAQPHPGSIGTAPPNLPAMAPVD